MALGYFIGGIITAVAIPFIISFTVFTVVMTIDTIKDWKHREEEEDV